MLECFLLKRKCASFREHLVVHLKLVTFGHWCRTSLELLSITKGSFPVALSSALIHSLNHATSTYWELIFQALCFVLVIKRWTKQVCPGRGFGLLPLQPLVDFMGALCKGIYFESLKKNNIILATVIDRYVLGCIKTALTPPLLGIAIPRFPSSSIPCV